MGCRSSGASPITTENGSVEAVAIGSGEYAASGLTATVCRYCRVPADNVVSAVEALSADGHERREENSAAMTSTRLDPTRVRSEEAR